MRFILFATMLLACEKDERPPPRVTEPPTPAAPSVVASKLKLDASLELESDPIVGPPGDLLVEAAAFTTVEECAKKHAPTDPLLLDAIEALGYETILRDTCRTLEALKSKNIGACKPIEVPRLRARCESSYAMAMQDVNQCPMLGSEEGHDPLCLAIAARTPALCAGVDTFENRVTCEVTFRGDRATTACSGLGLAAKVRCERFATRMRGYMSDAKALTLTPPIFRLALEPEDGSAKIDVDLSREIARGVLVTEARGQRRVRIGYARHQAGTLYVPSANQRARMSLVATTGKTLGTATIEHMEIEVPGRPSYVVPGARCDCNVRVIALGTTRGDDVDIEVSGTVGVLPNVVKVRAQMKTFVRDYVQEK
jgi:hypothetical protein